MTALLALSAAAIFPQQAAAATFKVTSSGDAGDVQPGDRTCASGPGSPPSCTLRAAIEEANALDGSDTISVPAFTIRLSAQLEISSPIELIGTGVDKTVVDGQGNRDFLLDGGPVALRGLTVQGGGGERVDAAGIYARSGTVEITDARIANNHAFVAGGGLYVTEDATVDVRRTTIEANTTVGLGGAGIENKGRLFVHESLIAGNDSNRSGGIRNLSGGQLVLRNTTVSENTAHSPSAGTGGIVNNGFAFLNNVTIRRNKGIGTSPGSFRGGGLLSSAAATTAVNNSIIAGNNGQGGPNDCAGALSSDSKYDLIQDTTGCELPPREQPPAPDTFVLGKDPKLGPLADNGGPTRTHRPAPDSPAIDAGFFGDPGGPAAESCEAIDQRGVPRLFCDIGAVELEVSVPTGFTVNTTADEVDAKPGNGICATANGLCSLRAAVQEANRLPGFQGIVVPAGTYDLSIPPEDEGGFDPAASGDLDLLDSVSLAGTDHASVVIVDGKKLSRIFEVAPLVKATISRVTIRNGSDSSGGGVLLTSFSSLDLSHAIVDGNASGSFGGGIGTSGIDTVLSVFDSVIRGNTAGSGGGIEAGGTTRIQETRIHNNTATDFGGGGLHASGTVTVFRSDISGNKALGSVLASGGGINAVGLHLIDSTVAGNEAGRQGGGVFTTGSSSSIVNSTISGNTSQTSGGGVSTSGELSLLHVTLARNQATAAGTALFRFGSGSELSLRNAILADPSGPECAGLLPLSKGNNIASDGSCALKASGDKQKTAALIGPLSDNGGPTLTHLLKIGSPAIDAAADAGLTRDQRGVKRPLGRAPDIGAVEGTSRGP